jgi:hypothetical protein
VLEDAQRVGAMGNACGLETQQRRKDQGCQDGQLNGKASGERALEQRPKVAQESVV